MYEKQREMWAKAAKGATKRFGPPSWLVQESMKPSEDFTACAVRLSRDIVVPAGDVGTNEYNRLLSLQKAKAAGVDVGTLCDACRKNPKEGRYNICAGCRKRAWRQSKA